MYSQCTRARAASCLGLAIVLGWMGCSSSDSGDEVDTFVGDGSEPGIDTGPSSLPEPDTGPSPVPCVDDNDCTQALAPGPCERARCTSANFCEWVAGNNGLPCDDENACTTETVCFQGSCGAVADLDAAPGALGSACLDNGDCDSGFCISVSPSKAICTETCLETCPKGFVCRSVLNAGQDLVFVCTPIGGLGMAVECQDGNPCTVDACDPLLGCSHEVIQGPCEDGNPCTADDQCVDGKCAGSSTPDCECTINADCAAIDDDNLCNGSLRCVGGECVLDPTTVVKCAEAGPCLESTCVPWSGQCITKAAPEGAACTDGNPCSQGDSCLAGVCSPGIDICGPCASHADCEPFDDGNACNGSLACLNATCQIAPGSVVTCTAPAGCEIHVCQPETGACLAAVAPDGLPCQDGEACTVGDVCADGACKPGFDVCEGCLGEADGTGCDDGDPCTYGETCQGGLCVPKFGIDCADDDPCTTDTCLPDATCAFPLSPDGTACEDGQFCTAGDSCVAGNCQPGNAAACDDSNSCTNDICDETTGCVFNPANEGAPCEDGNPCTTKDACAAGSCVGLELTNCDDGNPCTSDSCSVGAGCVYSPSSGLPCNDGNPCTSGDTCTQGVCAAQGGTNCDDGNPCTTDACAPGVGCTWTFNIAPCSDGNPCTTNDACFEGACAPGPNICACTTDIDCASNATPCSGALVCEVTAGAGLCVLGPGGQVQCPDDGNPCTQNACSDVAGGCVALPQGDGVTCDDGNACTLQDVCQAGTCVPGSFLVCNDANPCTDDVCTSAGGCVFPAIGGACDDGNECTVADACVGGACLGGAAATCGDSNPCTTDSCNPAIGCVFAPTSAACEDGNPCTVGDLCEAGVCVPGPNVCTCNNDGACAALDDGNPCTGKLFCDLSLPQPACVPNPATVPTCAAQEGGCMVSTCNPNSGGCETVSAANGTSCEDGNACTVGDSCLGGLCVPGPAQDCNDGNPCTDDGCTPGGGCAHIPNQAPCSDGNACTLGDVCVGGQCVWTTNQCGCQQNSDCLPFEDGNMCNGTLFCDLGQGAGFCAVAPGSTVACPAVPEAGGCTVNTCNPATGQCELQSAPNGLPCNDGDPCTGNDSCLLGACVGGNSLGCDDGNPCTNDVCNPTAGCQNKPIGSPCDDGDFCTVGDKCVGGVCVGGKKTCNCTKTTQCKKYDDGNLCTGTLACYPSQVDGKGKLQQGLCGLVPGSVINCGGSQSAGCQLSTCNPNTGACGLSNAPNGTACNDANVCTVGEICAGGSCAAASQLLCGVSTSCIEVSCDAALGCQDNWVAGPCDDGLSCTSGDNCEAGVCVASLNQCSCEHDADCDPYDDSNVCNGSLFCGLLGLCQVEPDTIPNCVALPTPSPCLSWTCSEQLGQCGLLPVADGSPCDDSDACTYGDRCIAGGCTPTGPVDCNDGNPCTQDSCSPFAGCLHFPITGPCDDGNPCTLGDKCVAGKCSFMNIKAKCP